MRNNKVVLFILSAFVIFQTANANNVNRLIYDTTGLSQAFLVIFNGTEKDSQLAHSCEQKTISSLAEKGYIVIPSSKLTFSLFDKITDTLNLEKVCSVTLAKAVLVITLIDKIDHQYKPDRNSGNDSLLLSSTKKYYKHPVKNIYAEEYYSIKKRYAWEYQLYETVRGGIICSGRSRSFAFQKRLNEFTRYIDLIVEAVEKNNSSFHNGNE